MKHVQAITKNEIKFAVSDFNVELKTFKDEYTRETATQIAVSTLVKRQEDISIQKIDDLCFTSFNFPISHRKFKPSKNIGGLSVKKRVDRYTYNNKLIDYDIDSESFTINNKILNRVKAIEKNKARKLFIFKTLEKVSIKGKQKNKALSVFKNKISDMLFMHLATMGKLTY